MPVGPTRKRWLEGLDGWSAPPRVAALSVAGESDCLGCQSGATADSPSL